jgi:hypothetical protein
MPVSLLDDHDAGSVRSDPRDYVLSGGCESVLLSDAPQAEYAAGHEATTAEDCVAEIPKAGIESEDGVRCFPHGV